MGYLKERKILVTNSRGAAGIPISESVIAMMLMLARKSLSSFKKQKERLWKHTSGIINIDNKTVGIIGTGDIGTQTAKRQSPLTRKKMNQL